VVRGGRESMLSARSMNDYNRSIRWDKSPFTIDRGVCSDTVNLQVEREDRRGESILM
jgi:hypothetical protein